MLENNKLIKVRNRDNGTVGYTIPDLGNLHRNFASGEVKELTMEELRKLSYIPGGDVLLRDYLVIEDKEAISELLGTVEPEYNYTDKEIEVLLKSGTMDQFMDALDFAPKGVVEIIKDMAVKMEINDLSKREAILQKTGFDVSKAIEINKLSKEESKEDNSTSTGRRAAPITIKQENAEPAPRSRYTIVNK